MILLTVGSASGGSTTVTAIKAGAAHITASIPAGTESQTELSAAVFVNIKQGQIDHIEIAPSSATVYAGKATPLVAKAKAKDGSIISVPAGNLQWSSSNTAVATVTGGNVMGVKPGVASISVKETSSGKSATASVTVKDGATQFPFNGERVVSGVASLTLVGAANYSSSSFQNDPAFPVNGSVESFTHSSPTGQDLYLDFHSTSGANLQIDLDSGTGFHTGDVFNLRRYDDGPLVDYEEYPPGRYWDQRSGTVRITRISGRTMDLSFDAVLAPNEDQPGGAVGTFSLKGTCSFTVGPDPNGN